MSELGCSAKRARTIAVRAANAGFSLLGILAAIVILAFLGVVGANVLRSPCEGEVGTAKAQISNLKSAVASYELKNDKYPQSLDELSRAGILDGEVPVDPWGNPYLYTVDGSKFLIVSYGADGRLGGSEYDTDINSDNLEGK